MIRDWNQYIWKNKHSGDCTLISAANAYTYLTGKQISNKRYEELIKICGYSYGDMGILEKAWEALEIDIVNTYKKYDKITSDMLPLETAVWHPMTGSHSVLIVQLEPITDSFRVTNFFQETTTDGWIYKEKFEVFLRQANEYCEYKTFPRYYREKSSYRQFGIANKEIK